MTNLTEKCPEHLKRGLAQIEASFPVWEKRNDQFSGIDFLNFLFERIKLAYRPDLMSLELYNWLYKTHWQTNRNNHLRQENPKKIAKKEGQKLRKKREKGTTKRGKQIAHKNRQNAQRKRQ